MDDSARAKDFRAVQRLYDFRIVSHTARGAGTLRTSLSQVIYSSVNRQWEAFALWRFSPNLQLRVSVQDLLAQDAISVNRFTEATGLITERSSIDPRFRRFSMLWEIKL